MVRLFVIIILLGITHTCYAQVYTQEQTRHRFAQLSLGLDLQSSFGGSTKYFDGQGDLQSLDLTNSYSPRFLIGGTHFYIAIPLYSSTRKENSQEVTALRGVETVFKYYPLRIANNKIRPYIGTSLAPFYFEQQNENIQYASGPELNHYSFPLLGGLTDSSQTHLIELGFAWNYQNKQDYFISRTQVEEINTPPIYATLSYRYLLETTLSAEEDWESGRTQEVTDKLADRGRLNGFYVGAGISSAFWLNQKR